MAEPSGQFRGKRTHTHGEKTVEVTFHACGYKKKPPELLHDLDFPASEIRALASKRSAGKKLPFKGCGQVPAGELTVQEMTPESFQGVDIALFSAGAGVSKEMRQAVVDAGAVMIDNSSAFRMDEDVPLVVPEVNPQDVAWHSGVIANPNCSTIQMVAAFEAAL